MNSYEKKLAEKKAYQHKRTEHPSHSLKKNKIERMQKIKKNAQLGMF